MTDKKASVNAPLAKRYDVIVIGTGAGGSSLAYQLSQFGLRVLVLEQGDFLTSAIRKTSDSIGRYMFDIINSRSDLAFVGGETKFYGSALYRLYESDFLAVQHENGVSPAWPFPYTELEPYYESAERLYRVHGSSHDCGPRRAQPFPYPAIEHAPIIAKVVRRIENSDNKVSAIPLGLDYGPNGRCVLCSTCDGHYCQIDAKMDAEVAALRPALAKRTTQLVTGVECVRVVTTKDGTGVAGVSVRYRGTKTEQVVDSDIVAVCAGVRRSVILLRRSRTSKHPDGLGNNNGCLGRHLAGHSVGTIFPFVSWNRIPPVYTKTFSINSYYHGAQDWPYPLGSIQMAGQMPFWQEAQSPLRPLARFVGKHALMCFFMTEALPTYDSKLIFDGDEIVGRVDPVHNVRSFLKLRKLAINVFRRAGYPVLARRRAPYVWHEVGTARLGNDPATSVVDPNCQAHGIKGLFVVDASVLPSAGALNTALTIVALGLRTGQYISKTS